MSIVRRVRDITVATLNEKLEKAEDPVRLIDNFLHAHREQISQAEHLYRQYMKHAEAMGKQVLQAGELAERREKQAEIALKAGEEEIARLALQEKVVNEEKYRQYKELYEEAMRAAEELESELHQLRAEYDEVLSKRQYYLARMEAIRLKKRMNERMYGLAASGEGAYGIFRRLEDKVNELELETRALADIRRLTQNTVYRAGTAIKETLEAELEKLKRKLEKEG